MVYVQPKLTIWERTTFIFAILRALSNGFLEFLLRPFRGRSGSAKYLNHIKVAMLRTFLKNTTVRQQQNLTPILDDLYPVFARKNGFEPSNVELSDGTKGYWIGNKEAEKILIWFHGGGYNCPIDPGHLDFVNQIAKNADGKLGVLMLSYTLAPHEVFPFQLRQAVELVRYTCTNLGRKPENVTIAGDSAGANLAIGVLSHLMRPHPEIEALRFEAGQKLGAAVLLAPWASFRTDWPSTTYNGKKDYVSAPIGDLWSESFLGGKKGDGYSEPLSAEPDWWKGLDGVVKEVLIVGGGDEIIIDPIRELMRRFEAVHPSVTTLVAEGEWHDKPINSALPRGGEQAEVVKSWVQARL